MLVRSRMKVRTPLRRDASILRFAPWQVCFANIAPALRCYLICSAYPWRSVFLLADQTTNLTAHPWKSIFRQQTYPSPEGNLNFPSANQTVPYPHICGSLFFADISIQPPLATYLHSSVGEFVYHKNRRWRSSPTVFFIKICSFVIYGQHFI